MEQSPENSKKIENLYKETDPTTFSPLPLGKEPVFVAGHAGRQVYEHEDETYFKLLKARSKQQIVSRLLKGIFPVADVVRTDSEYYSKELNHELIESKSSLEEAEVDVLVLELVFRDRDHSVWNEVGEGKNTKWDMDTHSIFDFDLSDLPANGASANSNEFAYPIKRRLDDLSPEQIGYLQRKLQEMRERFEGVDGGAFIESIAKAAEPGNGTVSASDSEMRQYGEKIQRYLLSRIADVEEVLEEMRGGGAKEAA